MNSQNLSRRQFVWLTSCAIGAGCMGLPGAFAAQEETEGWNPNQPFFSPGKKLKVQPVFMYSLPTPKEAASWKSWGGVQSEQAVAGEAARIDAELKQLAKKAGFGLEILPLAKVTTADATQKLSGVEWDVTLVYACTGGGNLLRACLELKPDTLVFVRKNSGPTYYWYEALSTKYLRTDSTDRPTDQNPAQSRTHVDDVVVDAYTELLWKLPALHAVKNFARDAHRGVGRAVGQVRTGRAAEMPGAVRDEDCGCQLRRFGSVCAARAGG